MLHCRYLCDLVEHIIKSSMFSEKGIVDMTPMQGSTSFGPNAEVYFSIDLCGSHRDENFRDLYGQTTEVFKRVFQLEDFDLLFLPGGGTLGIEAIMASAINPIDVVGCDGVFKDRWTQMASLYNSRKCGPSINLSCQVETSVSKFQDLEAPILGVVSSFPYHSIPDTCDVFVLASNKQLNSLAGLAIVGVRKGKFKEYFRDSELSYLSLDRYFESAAHDEMPSTVGTYLFDVLKTSLLSFNLASHRKRIDLVCELLVGYFGESMIVGDLKGPVLTIRREAIPEKIAKAWSLYEKSQPVPSYQIFTYSTQLENYVTFLDVVKTEMTK